MINDWCFAKDVGEAWNFKPADEPELLLTQLNDERDHLRGPS
jgi:hypothetical protein